MSMSNDGAGCSLDALDEIDPDNFLIMVGAVIATYELYIDAYGYFLCMLDSGAATEDQEQAVQEYLQRQRCVIENESVVRQILDDIALWPDRYQRMIDRAPWVEVTMQRFHVVMGRMKEIV